MKDFIQQIAREAGKILQNSSPQVIQEKGGGCNFLTQADLASEKYLIKQIRQKYPKHLILSEETLSEIHEPKKADNLWIIDPLDGTPNFSYGIPFYCVTLAFVRLNKVEVATTFDPVRHELFFAQHNLGAYLNGRKIQIQDKKELDGAIVDLDVPYNHADFIKNFKPAIALHAKGAMLVNLASAALEYAYVACGRLSAYYEIGNRPWDIAAGKLLIEEAGGEMREISGEFDLFHPKELLVGNKNLVQKIRAIL